MEIPKEVATALDPPAVHLVVKRTVKGNVIEISSPFSAYCPNNEISFCSEISFPGLANIGSCFFKKLQQLDKNIF